MIGLKELRELFSQSSPRKVYAADQNPVSAKTVGTTAALLAAVVAKPRWVELQNAGYTPVAIGPSDVAIASGLLLKDPKGSGGLVELFTLAAIYGVVERALEAMQGGVADDGGEQTDETAEANSAAVNDMTLLSATPAENDAYYFGGDRPFDELVLNIGTQGEGVWTLAWEYYNGSTWVAIPGVVDGTEGFTATAGEHSVTFTPPEDWAGTTVKAITAFWIRARVSAYTSVTTQPKGTQSWVTRNSSEVRVMEGNVV